MFPRRLSAAWPAPAEALSHAPETAIQCRNNSLFDMTTLCAQAALELRGLVHARPRQCTGVIEMCRANAKASICPMELWNSAE
ncbi:hypothetical protein BV25DRAFT_1350328 [Artomyces pyxidatus]|uniref:Uncharacterized protein n=1 Tax=Artomyces pyxidatus TaxID=48021 RepID=A0ACB8SNF1_9AGAM|nr:hypothetical protein BV25DRAFT_1350328 [Artomyces pyxidatus]